MALVPFVCPHCSGRFELENPPPGGQVGCPLCSQTLAVGAALPSPDRESGGAEFVPPLPETGARGRAEPPPLAFDPDEVSALALGRRRSRREREPVAAERPAARLSREEKERRRQVRSLVWLIGGVVLLAITAIVLSRL